MKQRKKHHIIVFIVLILISGACNFVSNRDLKYRAVDKGVEITEKAKDIYGLIDKKQFISPYQQSLFTTLNESDSVTSFPVKVESFQELDFRKEAFVQYGKAYVILNNMYLDKEVELHDSVINQFEELYSTTEKFLQKSGIRKNLVDSLPAIEHMRTYRKISQPIGLAFQLTYIYNEIWKSDRKNFDLYLENVYKKYNKGVESLPADIFDAEKVREMLEEPFADQQVLANLYKIKMKNDVKMHQENITNEFDKLGKALNILTELSSGTYYNDISKDQRRQMLEQIDELLQAPLREEEMKEEL